MIQQVKEKVASMPDAWVTLATVIVVAVIIALAFQAGTTYGWLLHERSQQEVER